MLFLALVLGLPMEGMETRWVRVAWMEVRVGEDQRVGLEQE
jgi:hypothetical protein